MGGDRDGGGSSGEPDFRYMSTVCPSCAGRMRPVDLESGAVVLRCPRCGQIAI